MKEKIDLSFINSVSAPILTDFRARFNKQNLRRYYDTLDSDGRLKRRFSM